MQKQKTIKSLKNKFEIKAVEKILSSEFNPREVKRYYQTLKNNKNQSEVLISLTHLYKIIKDKYKENTSLEYDRIKKVILANVNKVLHELFKKADHQSNKAQTWQAFANIIQNDQDIFKDLLGKYVKTDTDVINLYLTLTPNKQVRNMIDKWYTIKIRHTTSNSPFQITKAPKEIQTIMIDECVRQFLEENPQYEYKQ